MAQHSIHIDIDDPRTGLVAEALANKTCVKILSFLAETELTAVDIAEKLHAPLNTTGYNLDKLIRAGLIEKSVNFFWSVKGKKMPTYKVANKQIIISPKRIVNGVVPAVLASGVAMMIIRQFTLRETVNGGAAVFKSFANDVGVETARTFVAETTQTSGSSSSVFMQVWPWFFLGAVFSLFVFFLWNWFSYRRSFK
jgi:DNA-binding transcriptional ArsR family regulator